MEYRDLVKQLKPIYGIQGILIFIILIIVSFTELSVIPHSVLKFINLLILIVLIASTIAINNLLYKLDFFLYIHFRRDYLSKSINYAFNIISVIAILSSLIILGLHFSRLVYRIFFPISVIFLISHFYIIKYLIADREKYEEWEFITSTKRRLKDEIEQKQNIDNLNSNNIENKRRTYEQTL